MVNIYSEEGPRNWAIRFCEQSDELCRPVAAGDLALSQFEILSLTCEVRE